MVSVQALFGFKLVPWAETCIYKLFMKHPFAVVLYQHIRRDDTIAAESDTTVS